MFCKCYHSNRYRSDYFIHPLFFKISIERIEKMLLDYLKSSNHNHIVVREMFKEIFAKKDGYEYTFTIKDDLNGENVMYIMAFKNSIFASSKSKVKEKTIELRNYFKDYCIK